jgi:deazaflavin-dependent oxidoreductase (nitroreductase family)
MPIPTPPRGLKAIPWKLPILIYRAGFGWVLGERFLLLRHIGRISGKIRFAVLEVIEKLPDSDSYLVVSGFGQRSDWYQNIQKDNKVEIQIGRKRFAAVAHQLESGPGAQRLLAYAQNHPGSLRALSKLIGYDIEFSTQGILDFGHQIPVIQFTPEESPQEELSSSYSEQ